MSPKSAQRFWDNDLHEAEEHSADQKAKT